MMRPQEIIPHRHAKCPAVAGHRVDMKASLLLRAARGKNSTRGVLLLRLARKMSPTKDRPAERNRAQLS